MNLLGRIAASFITAGFAIIGGLWTAYMVLTNTMDSKIAAANSHMRIERTAQIGELRVEIRSVDKKLVEQGHDIREIRNFLIKGKP